MVASNRWPDGSRAGVGGLWLVALVAPLVCLAACATSTPRVGQIAAGDSGTAGRQILVTLEEVQPPPLRRPGSSSRGYVDASGYMVSERTRRTASRLARDYDLARRQSWPIRPLDIYCVVYEVPAELPLEEVITRLSQDARVESVQPMQSFEVQSSYDDPYVGMQHGMAATRVWDTHAWTAGRGVTVAVVDTAVDSEHPDLADNVVLSRDFVTEGARSQRIAEFHGTAVAGVIASAANNGIGTVGVAPRAWILALRACWETQAKGSSGTCNSFTLAKSLAFVVERRPEVVNLSVAGPPDPLLERLIRAALARGIAVVTAYRESVGAAAFPGSMSGVLAVGSPDSPIDEGTAPPLAAPARDILTTTPGGGFDFVSGSSFAAAHVSGVLALLLEKAPGLAVEQLGEVLRRTSRSVRGGPSADVPLVDACAALDQVATEGRCVRGAANRSSELVRPLAEIQ
jgi:subtilisin family serine protease